MFDREQCRTHAEYVRVPWSTKEIEPYRTEFRCASGLRPFWLTVRAAIVRTFV